MMITSICWCGLRWKIFLFLSFFLPLKGEFNLFQELWQLITCQIIQIIFDQIFQNWKSDNSLNLISMCVQPKLNVDDQKSRKIRENIFFSFLSRCLSDNENFLLFNFSKRETFFYNKMRIDFFERCYKTEDETIVSQRKTFSRESEKLFAWRKPQGKFARALYSLSA